jgi:hypothetical protein
LLNHVDLSNTSTVVRSTDIKPHLFFPHRKVARL